MLEKRTSSHNHNNRCIFLLFQTKMARKVCVSREMKNDPSSCCHRRKPPPFLEAYQNWEIDGGWNLSQWSWELKRRTHAATCNASGSNSSCQVPRGMEAHARFVPLRSEGCCRSNWRQSSARHGGGERSVFGVHAIISL